jgi:hypothetical protein
LPAPWKNADVIPVPKTKPINDIKNQLRPISLTPAISKIAEEFVIEFYIGPAILKTIDPDQFGAIPKSSTEQALISILHYLSKETDGTSAAVRLVLFDYRKAFDLIDHHLLVEKLNSLNIPLWVINWVTDFLTSRYQSIAFHGLSLRLGTSPFRSSSRNKIGTLALFTNDKRSQGPKRSHLEVRR